MKIVTFNINGVRTRYHQLEALRARHDPDVIGLQETKVADSAFPVEMTDELGYFSTFYGQKTHYGVAFLSKEEPLSVIKGFPGDDEGAQRRALTASFPTRDRPLTVVNGYFPQGESRDHPSKFPNKRRFYADMLAFIEGAFSKDDLLVVMGDMNVAPADRDVGIGEDNMKRWLRSGKCCFLPEEREWFDALTGWGLIDAYRAIYPEVDGRFSWFDYRSRGFERDPKRGLRIDHLLITPSLRERLIDVGIDYDIRALERPSDHCPVWATLDL